MNKHVEVLREVRKDGGIVPDGDYIAAIDAAIAALEWRPIGTAPKNGALLLLRNGTRKPFVGSYCRPAADWLDCDNAVRLPTHYLPIPAFTGAAE